MQYARKYASQRDTTIDIHDSPGSQTLKLS